MTSLDMFGFIDPVFRSIDATRTSFSGGAYDGDGIWQPGIPVISQHTITLQPLSMKEISFISLGGERQHDLRKIYVNDGNLYSISESDTWAFQISQGVNGNYKTISLDNRPWRNYCKIIVSRYDDQ